MGLKKALLNKVVIAPLVGFTDFPARRIIADFSPGLMFCEMIKVESLLYKPEIALNCHLKYQGYSGLSGGQICGSNPEQAGEAAKIIESLGFDVVDLNCGCPTDNIVKDGSGSGLLKTPELIGKIVEQMVLSVKIPVTVKIRSGWDCSNIRVGELVRIIEGAGASAVFIHGRTRTQGFKGSSSLDWIKEGKAAAKEILVFGNGDIFCADDAIKMMEYSSCDGVLVARGSIGNPWIVSEIIHKINTGEDLPRPSFLERKSMFLKHLGYVDDFYNSDRQLFIAAQKMCGYYLFSQPGVKKLRQQITIAKDRDKIYKLLQDVDENGIVLNE